MATFAAYLPPAEKPGSAVDNFQLVEDGKSTLALIMPPVWLIWHHLWLPLLAYTVIVFAIVLIGVWQPGLPVLYLSALPGLYLLLEGSELIRSRYERQGWRYAGCVEGDSLEDAEIRFVLDKDRYEWADAKEAAKQVNTVIHRSANTAGLFPE